ncbi:MAG: DUF3634 family protein [Luteolibacter sp.]|uniref:DUF3634 family protein n=1 Tax=Luteolibacter sp. TaxID=1962973 RepID=UPI003264ADE0
MNTIFESLCILLSWAWLFKIIDTVSPSGIPLIHLRFRNGKCTCIFGANRTWARQQIEEVLRDGHIETAVIKQLKNGRFVFSKSVPEDARQRIRNLIVSGQ